MTRLTYQTVKVSTGEVLLSDSPAEQVIDTVAERPKKADVAVRLVALVWCPQWNTKE